MLGLKLELEQFHYPGGLPLFRSLALEVAAGEMVALVGDSGSGKSSLLTLLAGLHPQPLGGLFEGRLLKGSDGKRAIGYLCSDPELFLTGFCQTVMEEVGWSLINQGWASKDVVHRVNSTLEELEISHLAWRDPGTLSGGQQQMVALAAVWAAQPDFLLLDEPASKLDYKSRSRLACVVKDIATTHKVGVVWASAYLQEVYWCSTLWKLLRGPLDSAEAGRSRLEVRSLTSDAAEDQSPEPKFAPTESASLERIIGKDALLEVDGLAYCLPGSSQPLFDNFCWKVFPGQCLGLVGRNGAGKTTLARLMRGLLTPNGGSIKVDGEVVSSASVARLASTIAYTFQDPENLFFCARVDAELLYSGELLDLGFKEAVRRQAEALDLFELTPYATYHPRELPASVAALLGVALSWYSKAKVQILDEPIARLDAKGRAILEKVIRGWMEQGVTSILIAHDLKWLSRVTSSVAVLDEGKILAQGSAARVFEQPEVIKALGLS